MNREVGNVTVIRTYQYRLYPTKSQQKRLDFTLNVCRRFYNQLLEEKRNAWEEEKQNVGLTELYRRVKVYRQEVPEASGVHSHILQVVVKDLDLAFQAFFRRVKNGETPGYPRFKGKNRFDSFGLKEYGNGFKLCGRRLKLSNIGRISVRWHRPLPSQPKAVRIVHKADGWYACFACEVEIKKLPSTGREVGIDVGVSSLVATSDGEVVPNPGWYRESQKEFRRQQRRVSRRKKGGNNRKKAVNVLARQHLKISRQRKDVLDKLAHKFTQENDFIAVEKLEVKNMVRNRHLAKSIMDSGWGYFIKRLHDKAAEAGRVVVEVNPKNTSQTCSGCGKKFEKKIGLAVRHVSCPCGMNLDRDINAAKNILRLGRSLWEPTLSLDGVSQEAVPL